VKRRRMKKPSLRVLVILATIAIAVSMSVTASEADVTVTTVTVSPESVEVGEILLTSILMEGFIEDKKQHPILSQQTIDIPLMNFTEKHSNMKKS